jgi:hypothetical protein
MQTCQIIYIKHKDSFRWKWRSVSAQGNVKESQQSYALYYECVMAARASGYQLELKCA